jgi:hypothetical protein
MAKTKNGNFFRRHAVTTVLLSMLVLIILLIPSYFIYEKVALELNRRAFIKARQAIDAAYADIIAQLGQPQSYQSKNSCSKGYINDFEQIMSCSVDIDFKYKVASQQESDALDQKIVSIISKSKYLTVAPAPPEKNFVTLAPGEKPDTSVHYFKSPGAIICTYRHIYGSDEESTSSLNIKLAPNDFYATFGCTGGARHQYYPLDAG